MARNKTSRLLEPAPPLQRSQRFGLGVQVLGQAGNNLLLPQIILQQGSLHCRTQLPMIRCGTHWLFSVSFSRDFFDTENVPEKASAVHFCFLSLFCEPHKPLAEYLIHS
jgi:hypothetical protein